MKSSSETINDYTDRVIEPNVYIDNMIEDDSSDISEHTPMAV